MLNRELESAKVMRCKASATSTQCVMIPVQYRDATRIVIHRDVHVVLCLQHCRVRPFENSNTVSDLFILHEQLCFASREDKALVRALQGNVALLNAEVERLKVCVCHCACVCVSTRVRYVPVWTLCVAVSRGGDSSGGHGRQRR